MKLNNDEVIALNKLIEYNYKDEEKNFEELDGPKDHIFRQIKLLRNALKSRFVKTY